MNHVLRKDRGKPARPAWQRAGGMIALAGVMACVFGLLWPMTLKHSALFSQKQPGGVYTIADIHKYPGNVFFVDSAHASASDAVGYGRNPDRPFATLAYAFSSDVLTASQGDVVVVMPRHAETIDAAADINCDIAGVTVMGLGRGNLRPTFTFATDTAADLEIDAANTTLQNLRFVVDVASLVAAIDVDAAGFTMEDCDFYGKDAATEAPAITVITDANANQMTIRRCSFNYLGCLDGTAITATPTECIRLVGADHAVIEDCYISGDFTTAAINGITTASLDVRIVRNEIHNIATENIAGIVDLVAGCNGVIGYNWGFMGYATSLAAIIDPASCGMVENYFSNVVTETGGLVGTAST